MALSRRQLIGTTAGLGLFAFWAGAPVSAKDMPPIPTDFDAQKCFEELMKAFAEKKSGIRTAPEMKDAPTAVMVFDPQCQWCVWEEAQLEPFTKKVNFIWFPVAVLNHWSEPQGAAILESRRPLEIWKQHRDNFRSADFKGLDVRKMEISLEARDAVWTNTKIYRRAGGREVPFGVLRAADGSFVPLQQMKREEFAKLTGIEP